MQFRGNRVHQQSFLMPTLAEQLDRRQPLRKLADAIPWEAFEKEFGEYYSEEGRPAKPVRLMVGLLLLKQMFNVSDERVVESWVQNPYWQYFCGMKEFQWELPCDPSDLVYFRRRIGEEGVTLIMGISANMHGEKAQESEVVIDTTAQEKNITYPDRHEALPQDHRAVLETGGSQRGETPAALRQGSAPVPDGAAMEEGPSQTQGGTPRPAQAADHRRAAGPRTATQAAGGRGCKASRRTSRFTAGCSIRSHTTKERFTHCMSRRSIAWPKERSTRNTNLAARRRWR